jgi:hypothetical protein
MKVCDSITCLNSGICSELNGTCLCLNGYYGDTCELYTVIPPIVNHVFTRIRLAQSKIIILKKFFQIIKI